MAGPAGAGTSVVRMSAPTDLLPPDRMPTVLREYLAAHAARDHRTALRTFTPDAVVTDEGRTYRGTAEIADFLAHAGAPYTFTTEVLGAQRAAADRWVVVVRIEGDFPGGTAELRYRTTLRDGLVAELVIAP